MVSIVAVYKQKRGQTVLKLNETRTLVKANTIKPEIISIDSLNNYTNQNEFASSGSNVSGYTEESSLAMPDQLVHAIKSTFFYYTKQKRKIKVIVFYFV